MEDLYSIHPGISRAGGGGAVAAASEASGVAGGAGSPPLPLPQPPPSPADLMELVKAQIRASVVPIPLLRLHRIMSLELAENCGKIAYSCVCVSGS